MPGREVWVLNSGCLTLKAHKCFSMHTQALFEQNYPKDHYYYKSESNLLDPGGDHETQLKNGEIKDLHQQYIESGAEVVTLDGCLGTTEYPLAEVVREFQTAYFTCGFAYMLAWGIYCKPKRLRLFGMDFDYGDLRAVYESGKPCAEWWLGRAQDRGIELFVPEKSNLLGCRQLLTEGLYGYGYQQPIFGQDAEGKTIIKGFADLPPKMEDVEKSIAKSGTPTSILREAAE